MALDATRLASAIKTGFLATPSIMAIDGEGLDAMCAAIAGAVLAEITVNAVVLPALLVAPPGGGPVTGTGVVT